MSATGSPSARRRPWQRDPILWLSLLLGFALRALPVVAYPRLIIWRDERLHYVMSVVVANVEQHVLGHWPPLYEMFLASIFGAVGPSMVAARWVQVVLSTVTVALVYALARSSGGERPARIAVALCALQPSLVAYSHYLYSETLFTALLVAAALAYHHRPGGPRGADRVVAGLLFGLAALTRSVALYFLPVWIAWLALRRRWPELRGVAVVLAVALLTIAPWTLRNALVLGDFVLVDTTAGRTAWWAYNDAPFGEDLGLPMLAAWSNREKCADVFHPGREELPPVEELRRFFPAPEALDARTAERLDFELSLIRRYGTLDLVTYQRCELASAADFVVGSPGVAAGRILQRVHWFWGPNSLLLRSVRWRSYRGGLLAPTSYRAIKWIVVASSVFVLLCALLAVGAREAPPIRDWVLLLCLYATALHGLTLAASRYRLPLEPFLLVLASLWLARPRRPETRGRSAAVVALVAAFLASSSLYVATILP